MNCNSLIVANWKMNKNIAETEKFFDELNSKSIKSHHKLVVCPPFTSLHIAKIKTNKTDISIGAQNCFYEDKGAFTGEVSASMLANMNIEYVIVGHSERRDYFKETNTVINKKIHAILKNKMKAILCVGEKLDVRSQGKAIEFVISQVEECLSNITENDMKNIIIAYEPIWSIGSGKAIEPSDAEDLCRNIRDFLSSKYSNSIVKNVPILYGGSLNGNNIKSFLELKNVNGGLIGGASLDVENFIKIINQ